MEIDRNFKHVYDVRNNMNVPHSNTVTPVNHVNEISFTSRSGEQFVADWLVTLPPWVIVLR